MLSLAQKRFFVTHFLISSSFLDCLETHSGEALSSFCNFFFLPLPNGKPYLLVFFLENWSYPGIGLLRGFPVKLENSRWHTSQHGAHTNLDKDH